MHKDMKFRLPEDFDRHEFIRELQACYRIQPEKTAREQYVYYDTFDWRLYNKSLLLCSTAHTLLLQSFETMTVLERAPMTVPPVWLADFPSGSLQEHVAPIIEMRALRQLFAMEAQYTPLCVLDDNAKTVLRLLVEVDTLTEVTDAPPFAACLWLKPIRGYDKAARKFAKWLTSKDWPLSHDHVYLQGLAAVKNPPGAYSSKIRVQLQPTLRADEAVKVLLRELFHIIKWNVEGITNDIDTEFLHDFRVAIRRARALLGQIKEVFPADVTAQLRQDCACLGSITNRLRDLDVYLLYKTRYQALLPPSIRPDIEPLFTHLQQERTEALHTLRHQLESPTYADIVQRWEAFLAQPAARETVAANASRPILEVVGKRLRRRYRSIEQLGTQLLAETDGERLHELRIACKKLRYVLECFISLFPDKKTAILLKHLRHLQDNLGQGHDLFVQQDALRHFATTLSRPDQQVHNTRLALDILLSRLEEERQTVNQAFPALFAAFAAQMSHVSTPAS